MVSFNYSGEAKNEEPPKEFVINVPFSTYFDKPKSAKRGEYYFVSNMFAGLMSPWMMFLLCIY